RRRQRSSNSSADNVSTVSCRARYAGRGSSGSRNISSQVPASPYPSRRSATGPIIARQRFVDVSWAPLYPASARFEADSGVAEGQLVPVDQLLVAHPDAVDAAAVGRTEVDHHEPGAVRADLRVGPARVRVAQH